MQKPAGVGDFESVSIVRGRHHASDPGEERAEVRRNLLRSLPRIDCKYFYDDAGSHLFEEITHLPEYYQTRTEEALLAEIADDVVALTGARELVELGSGVGRKVRLLLDAMQRRGRLERALLLDINETFIRTSAGKLAQQYPEIGVCGVVGDFLHDLELIGTGDNRLFIFLAGTIGNLYPLQLTAFLRNVRAVLGTQDAFLVGLDLVKDRDRLEAAYNDSAGVTAEFNLNALRTLNRRFGTAFDIDAFEHRAFYNTQAGHPFFGAGNPIIGFVHDRVVRAMLGGSWGSSGIIPGAVSAGEVYSTSYSHVVSGDQNVQNLTVVGVIQRYDADTNQRHILNAFEMAVDQPFFDDGFESSDVSAWTSSTP